MADKRLSSVHARRGFVINTLRKKTFRQVPSEKTVSLCAPRVHVYVVLQLSLLLLANFNSSWLRVIISLVALQGFAYRNVTSEGPRGGLSKKFSRLAIARHIFRPPHKLCCNSTTAPKWPEWDVEACTQLNCIEYVTVVPARNFLRTLQLHKSMTVARLSSHCFLININFLRR